MPDPLDRWFKAEILPHEASLMRFLARAWPNRCDLDDLRQEAYIRVCEAAQRAPLRAPRAFLFSIARHIMADRRRRERIVSIQAASDLDLSNDLVEEAGPDRLLEGHQELARLGEAFDRLPKRCRRVVWMRRVLDLSQKEVAQKLGVTVRTVEAQMLKGMRLLVTHMQHAVPDTREGAAAEELPAAELDKED